MTAIGPDPRHTSVGAPGQRRSGRDGADRSTVGDSRLDRTARVHRGGPSRSAVPVRDCVIFERGSKLGRMTYAAYAAHRAGV